MNPDTTSVRATPVPTREEERTAPAALANYGAVELEDGSVHLPGQGCRDPITNQCVGIQRAADGSIIGYDIRVQTEGVFRNIAALLRERGLELGHLVKVVVFMKSKADFEAMNEIWNKTFPDPASSPARTTVFVADLPGDNFIEMMPEASRLKRVE